MAGTDWIERAGFNSMGSGINTIRTQVNFLTEWNSSLKSAFLRWFPASVPDVRAIA
jgi:hypothetical protein